MFYGKTGFYICQIGFLYGFSGSFWSEIGKTGFSLHLALHLILSRNHIHYKIADSVKSDHFGNNIVITV